MSLVQHAEYELRRAGLFDADADNDGVIGPDVMELVQKFAAQGHSGHSAMLTLSVFETVARFKPLSPLSSDPAEWTEVVTDLWQNKRKGSTFSKDGGKTWYDIDEIPLPKESE